MPEHRKQKKEADVEMENLDGGACVYIPKKRNKKVKYPKGFNPELPGPMPDPERWLPKWQRSKYKKIAKKLGKYLKGAQGDSQVETDVQVLKQQYSTASVTTTQSKQQNKRKRRDRKSVV